MATPFYTYEGLNEARRSVRLHIDLRGVAAVHELDDGTVYLEGESISWTLRPAPEAVPALVEQWKAARAPSSQGS